MIYLRLFLSFLQIGAFSFGGGYAALPLIRHQVVEANGWLQLSEFTDLITISQMTPGPIAVNSATFVGLKVAGIPGAVICTLGCVLPSCILVSLIAKLYLKYRSMDLLQGVLKGLRPGSRGAHCVCRCGYHGVCAEHRWRRQNKTADGSDFCYLSGIAQKEMEPHSGDGTGRCHAGDLRIYNDVDGNIDR